MIPAQEDNLNRIQSEIDARLEKRVQNHIRLKDKSTEELQQIVANCLANTSYQDEKKRIRKMQDVSLAFNIIQYFNNH